MLFPRPKFLKRQPYIDSKRMALQGHSMGGYEVNYLITKTKWFTAAVSAAGVVDFVSSSGVPMSSGLDWHSMFEIGQLRMGTSIWQNIPAYIRSSPIFGADKVGTPLLMMHNKKDPAVNWSTNSLQFFTGLRQAR